MYYKFFMKHQTRYMPLGLSHCITPLPDEANDNFVSTPALHSTCVEFKS